MDQSQSFRKEQMVNQLMVKAKQKLQIYHKELTDLLPPELSEQQQLLGPE